MAWETDLVQSLYPSAKILGPYYLDYVTFEIQLPDKTFRKDFHRIVMEVLLGRPLETREEVHHKDGDTYNNEPENLEVLIKGGHMSLHMQNGGKEYLRQVNLGRKHTPEALEKMRQASTGRKHTPETIEKLRQINLAKGGFKRSV